MVTVVDKWLTYSTLIMLAVWMAVSVIYAWRNAPTSEEKVKAMLKWLELVKNLAPYVLMTIPGVPAALVPAIVNGITIAEQIPGATGAQKKAAVLAEVQIGLDTTNSIRPGTISTADTVAAVAAGIDATVSAVNAVHSVHQTLPPPPPVV